MTSIILRNRKKTPLKKRCSEGGTPGEFLGHKKLLPLLLINFADAKGDYGVYFVFNIFLKRGLCFTISKALTVFFTILVNFFAGCKHFIKV